MADNKSCEGKFITLECMRCGHREVFTEHQFKTTDGYSCRKCNGPVRSSLTKPGEPVRNRRMNKNNYVGGVDFSTGKDFTVKVGIDVSDAIKGLKAVQREARKTVQALKEVEGYSKVDELSDDDLVQILIKRGWNVEESELSTDVGISKRQVCATQNIGG